MKIALLKPPGGVSFGLDMIALTEPLGLECVAGALEADGHDCRIVDMRLDGLSAGFSKVQAFAPQIVGIQGNFTTERYRVLKTAQLVKDHLPGALLVVGGHDASRSPEWFQSPSIDVVVIGDGEYTIQQLARAREAGHDLKHVPGLMLNTPDGPFFSDPAPLHSNLDDLPLPARHLISDYAHHYYMSYCRPVALLETARGCPYRCNFCSVWKFHNGKFQQKSLDKVICELSQIDASNVFITDDIFWMDRDGGMELALAIKAAGIRKHFLLQTRSDVIVRSPGLVDAWKECGQLTVFLGLERIDDEGLKTIRKGNSAANNDRAIEILKKMNVGYTASFIVDPDWDHDDFARLRHWIERTGSYNSGFSILTPLPGTDLWEDVEDRLVTRDWDLFDLEHAVIPTRLPLSEFYEEYAGLWRHAYNVRIELKGRLSSNIKLLSALLTRKLTISAMRKGILVGKALSKSSIFLESHSESEKRVSRLGDVSSANRMNSI